MNNENTSSNEKQEINLTVINRVKRLYNMGAIDRDTAKFILKPTIDSINEDSKRLAKKLGVNPKYIDFTALMR